MKIVCTYHVRIVPTMKKLILKKKSPRTLKWGEYTRTRLLIKHPNQTVDYFEFLPLNSLFFYLFSLLINKNKNISTFSPNGFINHQNPPYLSPDLSPDPLIVLHIHNPTQGNACSFFSSVSLFFNPFIRYQRRGPGHLPFLTMDCT